MRIHSRRSPRIVTWGSDPAPREDVRWDLAEALERRGFDFLYEIEVVDDATLLLPLAPGDVDVDAYEGALREALADYRPAVIRDWFQFEVRLSWDALDRAAMTSLGRRIGELPNAVETPTGPYRFFGTDVRAGPSATVAEEPTGLSVEGLLEPRDHTALRDALVQLIDREYPWAWRPIVGSP